VTESTMRFDDGRDKLLVWDDIEVGVFLELGAFLAAGSVAGGDRLARVTA